MNYTKNARHMLGPHTTNATAKSIGRRRRKHNKNAPESIATNNKRIRITNRKETPNMHNIARPMLGPQNTNAMANSIGRRRRKYTQNTLLHATTTNDKNHNKTNRAAA